MVDNVADKTIFSSFFAIHPVIALRVTCDAIHAVPRGFGEESLESFAHSHDFGHFNLDLRRVALHSPRRLMEKKSRVRQSEASFSRCGAVDECACACDPTAADHFHLRANETDRVEDRVPRFHVPTLRVNEKHDWFVTHCRKGEQLTNGGSRQLGGDLAEHQDRTGPHELSVEGRRPAWEE